MSRREMISSRRLAAVALSSIALVGAGLAASPSISPVAAATQGSAQAPALLTDVPSVAEVFGARRGVSGHHRLVTLEVSALPKRADGQRLRLPLARGSASVRIDQVEHESGYTAWSGALESQELSSFSLVLADGVYRGSLTSPAGIYSLVRAEGEHYWWTEVAPRQSPSGEDAVAIPTPRRTAPALDESAERTSRRKRKPRISVLFAYTKAAKAEAGGKAALKATAALVIAQTNEAFKNSGLKAKVRYKGLAKAKGRESGVAMKDVFRLYRPRDGHFDNLTRARRRHHADLVHLLTTGSQYDLCGAGLIPYSPRRTHRSIAWSTSFLSCMPYLVATHELGHNLGADHADYAGISHDSKVRYSYAFHNVPGNYLSVMGYYTPCEDQGIFTCVRIPWFSSPTNTYAGQPLGVGRRTNNTLVIKKIAPRVARYVR